MRRAALVPRSGEGTDGSPEVVPVWQSPTVFAVTSGLILVLVTLADVLVSADVVVLTVLLPLAPLLASAVLRPAVTACFAAAAVALALGSGLWNAGQGAQYWVRVIAVVLLGVLAVLLATIRTRHEADLVASRRVATVAQQALLPVLPRRIGNIEMATRYNSATQAAQIGGDFFDFVADGGRLRLILGDVSGKGVDAIGQAARVIRAFRQYGASEAHLLDVARRVDEYVVPFWQSDFYATAVLVELHEHSSDELTVVSAGHPPPLLVSATGVQELPVEASVPLGLGPADSATRHEWRLGDRLLLYTDGLIEARNAERAFLPRHAIDRALQGDDLDVSLDALLATVHDYAQGFNDDLALLLMANAGPVPMARSASDSLVRELTL